MDLLARTVSRERHSITLTNREFSFLVLLMTASPKPGSKAMIIDRVWDRSCDSETNLVNVYVKHLLKKIDLPGWTRGRIRSGASALCCVRKKNEVFVVSASFLVRRHFRCGRGLPWKRPMRRYYCIPDVAVGLNSGYISRSTNPVDPSPIWK
jgi:hypothetical protein